MPKLNNLFASAVTLLILMFVLNDSVAQRNHYNIENESEATELHRGTTAEIYDFIKLHPRAYVEQLTKTNVNGRIQYVLGGRIAGKLHI